MEKAVQRRKKKPEEAVAAAERCGEKIDLPLICARQPDALGAGNLDNC